LSFSGPIFPWAYHTACYAERRKAYLFDIDKKDKYFVHNQHKIKNASLISRLKFKENHTVFDSGKDFI